MSARLAKVELPTLEHLNLSSMRQLSDATLLPFLKMAPNLQDLELSSAPFLFSSSYLQVDVNSRPNSAALTFSRFLLEVGKLVGSLRSINLSRTSISNSSLEALANVPKLQLHKVVLGSCKDISDGGVVALVTAQRDIVHLDLSSNAQLTAISLKHISSNLTALENLNFTKIRLNPVDLKLLQSLSCSKLVLSSCLLQPLHLAEVDSTFQRWAETMTYLDMSFCAGISNKAVYSMCNHLVNLSELNLSSCFQLDDRSVREISKSLTNLTSLSLAWCKHISDMGILGMFHEDFTHNCLENCRCGKLQQQQQNSGTPYFEYTPPVRDIAPKETIPTVMHVNSAIARHGEENIFPLYRLSKLTSLDLSVCSKLTDDGLILAIEFPSLVSLNLAMCSRITDHSLTAIASNNPLLESVNVSQCGQVTDRGVYALLTRCRRLTHLNLSNCTLVTDRTIETIIKRRIQLKSLDISMCNIGLEIIERLERLSPSLRTIHKRFTSSAAGALPRASSGKTKKFTMK